MSQSILFLEDDRAQMVIYKKLSDKFLSDYSVHFASSVNEAETILSEFSVGVAVLDLMIPEENGADLIMKMKRNPLYNEIKILVVSSAEKNSLIYDSLVKNIDGFITKPIKFDEFADTVIEMMG